MFFEERGLIPKGRFHEIGFEALEADPIGQVRGVYEALALPEFRQAEPALRRYVESLSGYKRTRCRSFRRNCGSESPGSGDDVLKSGVIRCSQAKMGDVVRTRPLIAHDDPLTSKVVGRLLSVTTEKKRRSHGGRHREIQETLGLFR